MGPIETNEPERTMASNAVSQRERIGLLSLIVLPYASYVGLSIMLGLLIVAMKERGGAGLGAMWSAGIWLADGRTAAER